MFVLVQVLPGGHAHAVHRLQRGVLDVVRQPLLHAGPGALREVLITTRPAAVPKCRKKVFPKRDPRGDRKKRGTAAAANEKKEGEGGEGRREDFYYCCTNVPSWLPLFLLPAADNFWIKTRYAKALLFKSQVSRPFITSLCK